MCAWISKVKKMLGIEEEKESELQRFFEKFGISRLELLDKKEVSLNEAYWYARIYALYAVIGDRHYKMHMHSIPNKPFVSIDIELKIYGRRVHLRNGNPEGDIINQDEARTVFSDESHRIADALARYWKGEKIIVRSDGTEELIVKLPETDYFVVAYNEIIG